MIIGSNENNMLAVFNNVCTTIASSLHIAAISVVHRKAHHQKQSIMLTFLVSCFKNRHQSYVTSVLYVDQSRKKKVLIACGSSKGF